MPSISHVDWSFSCLACTLKFPKFSALETNHINYRSNFRRSKQKMIYECVITQLVSLSITLHLYTYSFVAVYSCLQSVQEVTLFSSKCARQLCTRSVYSSSKNFSFMGQILWTYASRQQQFLPSQILLNARFFVKRKPLLSLLLL